MCYLIHDVETNPLGKDISSSPVVVVVGCTELGMLEKTCKNIVSLWMLRLSIQVEVKISLLLTAIIMIITLLKKSGLLWAVLFSLAMSVADTSFVVILGKQMVASWSCCEFALVRCTLLEVAGNMAGTACNEWFFVDAANICFK